jgi:hypothetical protein
MLRIPDSLKLNGYRIEIINAKKKPDGIKKIKPKG